MVGDGEIEGARWLKSSWSGSDSGCVSVAAVCALKPPTTAEMRPGSAVRTPAAADQECDPVA